MKAELKPTLAENDGLFWMSFEDFIRYFHRVNICHTNCANGQRWMECRHKGLVRYTDSGVQCPYFSIRVPRDTEMWISLHQDDERMLHAQPYIDLDFIVVRDDGPDKREVIKRVHGMWDRQTQVSSLKKTNVDANSEDLHSVTTGILALRILSQLHLDKVPAGNYLVLPYTSNILRQRKVHRALESVFDSHGALTKTYLQVWHHFR